MKSAFPMLTEKMQMLFGDIIASLGQLPDEMREYLFGEYGEEDMAWVLGVAKYIVLEYIKYSYDHDDPEYPIRHFLDDIDNDSERMLQSRIMKYVSDHKKREIERGGIPIPPDHKFADLSMESIDKKLKGYRLTDMNYFEHQNIHNLELIKAIIERRIVSSKKISNDRFQEMFKQYDEFVESLIERSKRNDEDMVFSSLAFFTFEWHYPVETFYNLACLMEENGIETVDRDTLILICSRPEIESIFGGNITVDSRMVKERIIMLKPLFIVKLNHEDKEELLTLVKEIIVLIGHYLIHMTAGEEEEPYKEWFRKESSMADWASFLNYYDIFSIWQKKEWTRARIQNMRHLFDLVLLPKG